jgi:hypothetical protein
MAKSFLVRTLRYSQGEGAQSDPSVVERAHEVREARAFIAKPVLLRHLHVVEDQLACIGRSPPELVLLLARAKTAQRWQRCLMSDADCLRLLHINGVLGQDEGRDPVLSLRRIGGCRDDEDFADASVGD